jgi:hypothetical protein
LFKEKFQQNNGTDLKDTNVSTQIKEEEEQQTFDDHSDLQARHLHSKQTQFRQSQPLKQITNPLVLNTTQNSFQQQQHLHNNIVEQIQIGLSQLQQMTSANQQRTSVINGIPQQISPLQIAHQSQQQSQISHFLPSPSQPTCNNKKRPHSFENSNCSEQLNSFNQKQQSINNFNFTPSPSIPQNNSNNNAHTANQRFNPIQFQNHFPVSSSDLLYISNAAQGAAQSKNM